VVWADPSRSVRDAVEGAREAAEARQRTERSRLEMLRGYAETTGCRRQFLLGYFGEQLEHPCGQCDTCRAGTASEGGASDEAGGWRVDDRVEHAQWGPGVVMRTEGDRLTVLFEREGYRTLAVRAVEEHDLLTRA
jgi:ATP-dependent DNA helicase RecQ